MKDRARMDFIHALTSVATFMEAVENDFRKNGLSHHERIDDIKDCLQTLLNSLDYVGDLDLMLDHRLQNLQDHLFDLAAAVQEKVEKRIVFSDPATEEMSRIFKESKAFLRIAVDFLRTDSATQFRWLEKRQAECRKNCDECAASHEKRLVEGICIPDASLVYLDMLHAFAGVHSQLVNVIRLCAGIQDARAAKVGAVGIGISSLSW